jgi:hypothetical protein
MEERRRGRKPRTRLVCPRCGAVGSLESYVSGGRRYLRIRHGSGRDRSYCYVGPAEAYVHAETLHLLGLTNIRDVDYAQVAESAVRNFMREVRLRRFSEPTESLLGKVRLLMRTLQGLVKELGELEEDLLRDLEAEERRSEEE